MPEAYRLYERLPVFMQNASVTLEGMRINRTRYGSRFDHLLSDYEKRQSMSIDQLVEFRDERLRRFVAHAMSTVPYYRQLSRELDIASSDIQDLSSLSRLPILTKDDVRDNPQLFQSSGIDASQQTIVHTSGTTGAGFRFATTASALREQWAVWWRYRRAHGIERHTWCGYFGGRSIVPTDSKRPPFWRYNVSARQVLFSGYHLGPDTVGLYVNELLRRRIQWLHGYPSALVIVADYLRNSDKVRYQPQWVTTGAESLLPQQASLIASAFGVQPIEHYGLAEAVANASMCRNRVFHIDEEFAAVELLPEPGGHAFRVVGTNLSNLATPLLRYDTGDLVSGTSLECACGQRGRSLVSIDGRREDYVVLSSGARVGRVDHIFKDLVHIRAAQLYQSVPGAVTVRIVKGLHYDDADEALLLRELRRRLGTEMKVVFEYHDDLERTASGKLRLVVSDLPLGRANADG